MSQQDLERLETEAAEMVGAMKDLFREFERHLGEIVSAQRMASSEARAEGAQVTKDLYELKTSARILVGKPVQQQPSTAPAAPVSGAGSLTGSGSYNPGSVSVDLDPTFCWYRHDMCRI
jgi:hypothetical protein